MDDRLNAALITISSKEMQTKYGMFLTKLIFAFINPANVLNIELFGEGMKLGLEIRSGIDDKITEVYFKRYLEGSFKTQADKEMFVGNLMSKGEGYLEDNIIRIIKLISKIDSERKIECLVRATRLLMINDNKLEAFFRVCHIIENTLAEDLWYLAAHIKDKKIKYNNNIQGLMNNGLVYTSLIDSDNGNLYDFTATAVLVYECITGIVCERDIANIIGTDNGMTPISESEIDELWRI